MEARCASFRSRTMAVCAPSRQRLMEGAICTCIAR